jgi:dihydrofolate reductase
MRTIVIQFTTLDGVTEDPEAWAFRYGPEAVGGDKFRLGATLEDGCLLFGRRTWEHFARLWPARDDPFARRMNAARKLVATRSDLDVSAWSASSVVGSPVEAVRASDRDVVVVGSASVVAQLAAEDLVDEYRLLVFPTVRGEGYRLLGDVGPTDLRLVSAAANGPVVLLTYER